jgi:hypothetical protein
MHLETNAGKTWTKSDLLFLNDALERGMSFVELAGFLRRREDEVREKARQLRAHWALAQSPAEMASLSWGRLSTTAFQGRWRRGFVISEHSSDALVLFGQ